MRASGRGGKGGGDLQLEKPVMGSQLPGDDDDDDVDGAFISTGHVLLPSR